MQNPVHKERDDGKTVILFCNYRIIPWHEKNPQVIVNVQIMLFYIINKVIYNFVFFTSEGLYMW